jgi:hypothetical protein
MVTPQVGARIKQDRVQGNCYIKTKSLLFGSKHKAASTNIPVPPGTPLDFHSHFDDRNNGWFAAWPFKEGLNKSIQDLSDHAKAKSVISALLHNNDL